MELVQFLEHFVTALVGVIFSASWSLPDVLVAQSTVDAVLVKLSL